jgi:putative inorganic carbon (HCO3(-)) transporter
MTALAAPPVSSPTAAAAAVPKRVLPGILVGFAVAYVTMPFAHATGGREPWSLTKAAIVVAVALIAARPWRELRTGVLVLAVAVSLAALAVCLVTAPGWFDGSRAASYALAAATFVAVASYARSVRRANWIAAIVATAGAMQFCWSFVSWWGGRDQSIPMVGTFYWHNQFAAFLLAPGLIALALIVRHRSPWRLVGWVVAPLAVAGIVHSTSRGGMAVLFAGWLAIGILALRVRPNRRAFVRWVAASVLAAGATVVVAGPPFFSSSASPLAATAARASSGETADANSSYRVLMWRESVTVFEHHPVTGVGYGGLMSSAGELTPASWPRSPLAHDDYLQALAEGGLLLGVPFLLACGAIAFGLVRVGRSRVRSRIVDVRTGVVIAAMALMAHAAIDFDWTYPALFCLAAVVTALAVAPLLRRPSNEPADAFAAQARSREWWVRVALVALLVGVTAGSGLVEHRGGLQIAYKSAPTATPSVSTGTGTG